MRTAAQDFAGAIEPLTALEERFGLALRVRSAETLSGALVALVGRFRTVGERTGFGGAVMEVLPVQGIQAARVRMILHQGLAGAS